jgi:nicotinamidase-related amidase
VDSTARDADDAGLHVQVLEHCCVSPDPEPHRIECEKVLALFGQVITSEAFLTAL